MKKLVMFMVLSLAACNNNNNNSAPPAPVDLSHEVTIHFDGNDASNSSQFIPPICARTGETFTLPANVYYKMNNEEFTGWCTDNSGSYTYSWYCDEATIQLDHSAPLNITLYAQFDIPIKSKTTYMFETINVDMVYVCNKRTPVDIPYPKTNPDAANMTVGSGSYVLFDYDMPIEDYDSETRTVNRPFYLAEAVIHVALARAIYDWATDEARGEKKYKLRDFPPDPGLGPNRAEQNLFWYWVLYCNAITEYFNEKGQNLTCVYYEDEYYTKILRSFPTDNYAIDNEDKLPYVKADMPGNVETNNCTANGFRIPTSVEWQYAARYIDGKTWLYGDHVSGDVSGPCFLKPGASKGLGGQALSTIWKNYAFDVVEEPIGSSNIKTKLPNQLGLYDMSGLREEVCFEFYPGTTRRFCQGGGVPKKMGVALRQGRKGYCVYGALRLARFK